MTGIIARRAANYIPAILVAATYVVLSEVFDLDPFRSLDHGTKATTYQTLAEIAAATLSLGVVSFSVLFAVLPRSRLASVVAYGRPLRVWLIGSFIALGVAMLGFGILLPLDHTDKPTIARYVAAGLTAVVATSLAELIYIADRTYRTLSSSIAAELDQHDRDDGGFDVIPPDATGHEVPARQLGRRR